MAATSQPESLQDRVLVVLDAVRPAIQADGGDVEFVEITDSGEVRIRLLGACVECPSAHLTLRLGIERNLVDRIPEVTSVVAVP
ncbi:MAG: NifU family protein [Phycisphaerales bacterium]|jgi:Fe-S cluster biogenesis protein NfuA|nr:NifU family protein [Phycisphaerales bacterium]